MENFKSILKEISLKKKTFAKIDRKSNDFAAKILDNEVEVSKKDKKIIDDSIKKSDDEFLKFCAKKTKNMTRRNGKQWYQHKAAIKELERRKMKRSFSYS